MRKYIIGLLLAKILSYWLICNKIVFCYAKVPLVHFVLYKNHFVNLILIYFAQNVNIVHNIHINTWYSILTFVVEVLNYELKFSHFWEYRPMRIISTMKWKSWFDAISSFITSSNLHTFKHIYLYITKQSTDLFCF